MALTDRQLRFVEEYIKDYNATQAALRAGYSEVTASTSGYRNTKNDEIREVIKERQEELRVQLQQQFSNDAVVARKIMLDIMRDDEAQDNVRLSAAKDFLDRAGFKPVERQETEINGQLDISNKSDVINKYLKSDADDS